MNPLLKIRNEYKSALQKIANHEPITFKSFEEVFTPDYLSRMREISEKAWEEVSDDDVRFCSEFIGDDFSFNQESWPLFTDASRKIVHSIDVFLGFKPMLERVLIPTMEILHLASQREEVETCKNGEIQIHLTSEEIYEALLDLNDTIATTLIRRISASSPSVIDRLLKAYSGRDTESFCSILDNESCDISHIERFFNSEYIADSSLYTELLKVLDMSPYDENWLALERESLMALQDVSASDGEEDDDDDPMTDMIETVKKETTEITNGLFSSSLESIVKLYQSTEMMCSAYDENINLIFDLFIESMNDGTLNNSEREVLESVMTRPEGIELYNQCKEEYEKRQHTIDEQKPVVALQEPTPVQSINPATHKVESAGPKKGRPRSKWYMDDFEEDEVRQKLNSNVWLGIRLYLDELKYYHAAGGTTAPAKDKAKDKAMKTFGAALILYSAGYVGLAKEPITKCTDAMAESLSFLGVARNSIAPYLELLDKVFYLPYTRESKALPQKYLDAAFKECSDVKQVHMLFLMENYLKVIILFNNTQFLLNDAFGLKKKIRKIEWPEEEDRALKRAKSYDEEYRRDALDDDNY